MRSKSVQIVFNNPHDMDEDNEVDRTLWCGNLADEITEECLYELFLQVKINCSVLSLSFVFGETKTRLNMTISVLT